MEFTIYPDFHTGSVNSTAKKSNMVTKKMMYFLKAFLE